MHWSFPVLSDEVANLVLQDMADSTNDVLMSLAGACVDYTAVLTTNQVSGRGRLAREWKTEPGNGIAFSFITPECSAKRLTWVPLLVGAAMTAHLRRLGIENAQLKWPNDVLIGDGKISGILCEVGPRQRVVVGVGLNVRWTGLPFPRAISLSEVLEDSYQVADIVLAAAVKGIREYFEESPQEADSWARSRVLEMLGTIGRSVRVTELNGLQWSGLARDISGEGHLIVEDSASGESRRVIAADIEHVRQ